MGEQNGAPEPRSARLIEVEVIGRGPVTLDVSQTTFTHADAPLRSSLLRSGGEGIEPSRNGLSPFRGLPVGIRDCHCRHWPLPLPALTGWNGHQRPNPPDLYSSWSSTSGAQRRSSYESTAGSAAVKHEIGACAQYAPGHGFDVLYCREVF